MGYVIGIDGGGTKTLLKIADRNGKLLVVCQGGPSNIYSSSLDTVKANIHQLINDGLQQLNIDINSLDCVCMGTAGAGREDEQNLLKKLLREVGISCNIIITDDAITALYGALGKGEGIILISGTGSICYGRKDDGTIYRSGGWGHIIGDEGSGYDIGRCILTKVMRSYDGRDNKTILTTLALDTLGLKTPEELIPYVYKSGIGKSEIARLGSLLDKACIMGDTAALSIAHEAATELFQCVKSVIDKLNFSQLHIELAMQGSVLEKGHSVKKIIEALLNDIYPMIDIKKPVNDAAWGAVLMAQEFLM